MPRKMRVGAPVLLCPRQGGSRNGLVTGLSTCCACVAVVELSPAASRFLQVDAKAEVLCFACGRRRAGGGPVEVRLLPDQEEEITAELGIDEQEFRERSARALLEP